MRRPGKDSGETREAPRRSWRSCWMRGGRDAQRGSWPAGVAQPPTGRGELQRAVSLDQKGSAAQERQYSSVEGERRGKRFAKLLEQAQLLGLLAWPHWPLAAPDRVP